MSRLVFITGGARSGKSGFAVTEAEKAGDRLVYIATATAGDPEMEERIRRHRDERGNGWETIEEPLDLAGTVKRIPPERVIVIDCLTLWLTNLLMQNSEGFEDRAKQEAVRVAAALKAYEGDVFVVSNEVGLGLVPENALARIFRDAAGAVNRKMAEAADEVYLVVSGLPLKIK